MNRLTGLVGIIFLLFSCGDANPPKLPILGNVDLLYKTVNGQTKVDTLYASIPPFRYLNQDSIWVNNAHYKNRIWVVEFFFATCPTICPIMNTQFKQLNRETASIKKHIQFLSFSINPTHDTPHVLKKYMKDHQILANNWDFLTGNEAETHRLGIENFLTFAGRDDEAQGGYAHSGSFTLVDKSGHVRGVYAVTNPDLTVNKKEYKRLKTDLFNLLKYEYHVNK
ncbi:MAG: SCO family protein [Flavobacteriales bacterium]